MARKSSGQQSAMVAAVVAAASAAGVVAPVIWMVSRGRGGVRPIPSGGGESGDRGVTVTGRGMASVAPDEARITAGIQVRAATAKEASARGAEAMQRVIAALKAHEVPDKRIQTGFYSISPEYSQGTGQEGARKVGYITTNTVVATITELDRVGAILDALVEAGGDDVTIQGVHLAARDTTEAQTRARSAAVTDARTQAEQLARDLGVRLGPPVSVRQTSVSSGGGMPIRPMMMRAAFSAGGAAPTPIEAGEIEVSVEVEIVWAMA
ncbi:MAG TPA: SIMPL domain-containing protein [Ktedonobacterales bacterium]